MKKENNEIADQPPPERRVRIEFHDEKAQEVCIAGTFNDWRPTATQMVNVGESRWVKELILPPGRYEYRLVVDGRWTCDPGATEKVPNPFGEFNSVLDVPRSNSGSDSGSRARRKR
jgi:1,4-alpha-glucan branching enzyme